MAIDKDLFADLVNSDDQLSSFEDADIKGDVYDWVPTLVPQVDSTMMGGFPLSGRVTEIFGKASVGKAVRSSQLIPTPTGMQKISELSVGDKVFDRLGNPTKIIGVYPQGKLDVYRVTLSDGRYLDVNNEHIWSVYTTRGKLINKTTQEMINKGVKTEAGSIRFKIPSNGATKYNEIPVKVDPYVLGALLGDGCLGKRQLTMSSNDPFVIKKVAKNIGYVVPHRVSTHNYSWHFKLNCRAGQKEFLQTADYLKDVLLVPMKTRSKFIPENYLYNSQEVRYSLAQGLLDTDGNVTFRDGKSSMIRWTSVNERLSKQFVSLVRSLGYAATLNSYFHKGKGVEYTLNIMGKSNDLSKLVTLPRQKDKFNKAEENGRHFKMVSIKSIEKLNEQDEMECLYVDNDEHLFQAGDYIVTHNTTVTEEAIKVALNMGVFVVMFDVEGTTSQDRLISVGIDPKDLIVFSPTRKKDGTVEPITVEDVMSKLIELPAKLYKKDPTKKILFVWDTLAVTMPRTVADKAVGEQSVGQQARALSEGFRKAIPNLLANGAGLIILNQARDDIGGNPFLSQVKTVGGKAVEHADSMRLYMSSLKKITENASSKEPIGHWAQFKFVKSKIGDNSGKYALSAIMHDDDNGIIGLDFAFNIFQEAVIAGILPKGGWKSYEIQEGEHKGETIKFQTANEWVSYLKSEDGQEVLKEFWQSLTKKEFPKCYPPLFNLNVPLKEEDYPFVAGLKDYYIKIQESLPETAQHPNYKFWKNSQSASGKKRKKAGSNK